MAATTHTYDTEQGLKDGLLSGNKGALDQLYSKYAPLLMGFIMSTERDMRTAEETLQEVFITMWHSKQEYAGKAGSLLTYMLRQARGRARAKAAAAGQNIINNEIPIPAIFVNRDGALAATPSDIAETVFEMVHHKGCSIGEVAVALQLTAGEVKKLLRSAMNKIKTVQHG